MATPVKVDILGAGLAAGYEPRVDNAAPRAIDFLVSEDLLITHGRRIRLDGEERRKAIVEAAMPLFARKGFARTTTKEIAEAAHVSEALLFKHFPSKVALYEEILRFGCRDVDPALERLQTLEASTATLVHMTHFMVRHVATGLLGDPAEQDVKHRLMVNSFLEDGEFARIVFENIFAWVYPKFAACLARPRPRPAT